MSAGHILLIDDEENLRRTLTRVLKQAQYEVTTAAEGGEALQILGNSGVDLVFLDIRLPGMDGLQILKEIRARASDLPVILLTAYGSMQTALEALRLGATDYLLKPVNPEVLLERTRKIIGEQAVLKRRREIQQQIAALQEELRSLEAGLPAEMSPAVEPASSDRFVKCGMLVLDLQAHRATFRDHALSLPPATFDYLVVLARHAPGVVAYQTLVSEAQGYRTEMGEARELSKWHVHALRRALETVSGESQLLINVRGVGYRLLLD